MLIEIFHYENQSSVHQSISASSPLKLHQKLRSYDAGVTGVMVPGLEAHEHFKLVVKNGCPLKDVCVFPMN